MAIASLQPFGRAIKIKIKRKIKHADTNSRFNVDNIIYKWTQLLPGWWVVAIKYSTLYISIFDLIFSDTKGIDNSNDYPKLCEDYVPCEVWLGEAILQGRGGEVRKSIYIYILCKTSEFEFWNNRLFVWNWKKGQSSFVAIVLMRDFTTSLHLCSVFVAPGMWSPKVEAKRDSVTDIECL